MAYELDRSASPAAAVQFKLGTQAAMDVLLSKNSTAPGGVHGTFYLTQDTHRLYVGNSDKTISPVNEGIITVKNTTELPNATSTPPARPGQFYYLTDDNILAIYNGRDWIQINSTSSLTGLTVTGTDTAGTIKVNTRVSDTGAQYDSHFNLSGSNGITLSNAGTNGENITITGNIGSLSAADYTDGVTVTLENSNGTDDTQNLKEGVNVQIEMDGNDIKFSATDSTISTVTTSTRTAAQGGGFGVKVTDTSGANATGYITPKIVYGGSGGSEASFDGGTATLNVYTKTETDTAISTAIRTVNAMTYKGTTSGTLPGVSDNVQIGDTYILTDPVTVSGTTYPAGSMVIASSKNTEGANGYITGSSIDWDYVNSTGADTTYSAANATNGFTITPSTGGILAKFMLSAGTAMSISASGDVNTSAGRTVTIAHATVNSNVAAIKTSSADFEEGYNTTSTTPEIVTGITVNEQGHVTGYTVQKLKLHSEIGDLVAIGYSDTGSNLNTTSHTYTNITGTAAASGYTATSTAGVKLGYALHKPDGSYSRASNEFNIASRSLEVTSSGMNAYVDLVWGSFT